MIKIKQKYRIAFVGTRFSGIDGVSLETEKWDEVLTQMGHKCFYWTGESEVNHGRIVQTVPLASFQHPVILGLQKQYFSINQRKPKITQQTEKIKIDLKKNLHRFIKKHRIDIIIPQNALSIPMHIPLGLAITEFLIESGIPAISHNHDYYWERQRFSVNCVHDYLDSAFPPRFPNIQHVCINTIAQEELAYRKGISSNIIPNVMPFKQNPPQEDIAITKKLRKDFGIEDNELLILQPTRIVPRKRIEKAIGLVGIMNRFRPAKLLITHSWGDEGDAYLKKLQNLAKRDKTPMILAYEQLATKRGKNKKGQNTYTLEDYYLAADMMTYPSIAGEGFGNAFLEGLYYQKLIAINNYPVYEKDIKPLDFEVIEFDDEPRINHVRKALAYLEDQKKLKKAVAYNYKLGMKHFSYQALSNKLNYLIYLCYLCIKH
ncbi:MAG: glycosyltransferase family 1 protein [Candidatus Moranbacteria bacterium]|nr:glycosyltransferase family 1 protein [Candidatus Moranbacteria bacterium]